MEDGTKKKIEFKNIKDILSENLRIQNAQESNENKSDDSHTITHPSIQEETPIKAPSYFRQPFSQQDWDVTQLDLKKVNLGKKILHPFRKSLHREIRDWILFPFQKKANPI